MESRRLCPVWLAHFTECSVLQVRLLWQRSERPLRLNSVLLSAWTPLCPSTHLSGSWGCFLPLAAVMTRPWTRGARVSLRPCFPGSAGSCADVDSQTQELSPTALAGEVLGSLARGGMAGQPNAPHHGQL